MNRLILDEATVSPTPRLNKNGQYQFNFKLDDDEKDPKKVEAGKKAAEKRKTNNQIQQDTTQQLEQPEEEKVYEYIEDGEWKKAYDEAVKKGNLKAVNIVLDNFIHNKMSETEEKLNKDTALKGFVRKQLVNMGFNQTDNPFINFLKKALGPMDVTMDYYQLATINNLYHSGIITKKNLRGDGTNTGDKVLFNKSLYAQTKNNYKDFEWLLKLYLKNVQAYEQNSNDPNNVSVKIITSMLDGSNFKPISEIKKSLYDNGVDPEEDREDYKTAKVFTNKLINILGKDVVNKIYTTTNEVDVYNLLYKGLTRYKNTQQAQQQNGGNQ